MNNNFLQPKMNEEQFFVQQKIHEQQLSTTSTEKAD